MKNQSTTVRTVVLPSEIHKMSCLTRGTEGRIRDATNKRQDDKFCCGTGSHVFAHLPLHGWPSVVLLGDEAGSTYSGMTGEDRSMGPVHHMQSLRKRSKQLVWRTAPGDRNIS